METFEPIPYVDDEDVPPCREINLKKSDLQENNNVTSTSAETTNKSQTVFPQVQVQAQIHSQNQRQVQPKLSISNVTSNRRGRLDKSHSTPAYDNSGEDSGKKSGLAISN